MQELETLLASLYKRGWKPKDREIISIKIDQEFTKSEGRTILHCNCKDWSWFYADLRWLVSLESGLWEFVCSQKLLSDKVDMKDYIEDSYWFQDKPYDKDGFYWVMRCARLEEQELGKFLVDNIKIEWK